MLYSRNEISDKGNIRAPPVAEGATPGKITNRAQPYNHFRNATRTVITSDASDFGLSLLISPIILFGNMSSVLRFVHLALAEGLCGLPHQIGFNDVPYMLPFFPCDVDRAILKDSLLACVAMLLDTFRSLLLSTLVGSLGYASAQSYTENTEAALKPLMDYYNEDNGLWNTTGWWNSANVLTMLGDLAAVDPGVKRLAEDVFANTLVQAQEYNLGQSKVIATDYIMVTEWKTEAIVSPKGFLNSYYDDEGWWALGWIQAYDVTGNQTYLDTAVDIFADMMKGNSTPCGGGIWWDKAQTYVNAVANELYMSVASHLANRIPAQKTFYVSIALTQWTWFLNSGMTNARHTINDGLNSTCKNNGGTVWSYNQGVILGALVELNKASPNSTYISTAKSIASAAIKALSTKGVLHDPCEPNCGADGNQFKGIFMRNLQILQAAAPDDAYLAFIGSNANSIWKNDRNAANELSVNWAGPFVGNATASTQSSAMDALVAAVAFEGKLGNGIAS